MTKVYKLLSAINTKTVLVGLVLFVVLFWYLSFEGYYGYDDIKYCLFAFDLYNGELPSEDSIFSQRIGFYLPLSFLYLLFGVNDFSSTLWPLVLTVTTLVSIYHLLRNDQPMHGLIAGILFGLNYYTIFFSNKIYPDVAIACLGFLSLYILYKRDSSGYSFKQPFIFVALISWAFLCKESILYLFPFYLLVLINDLILKKNYSFWKYAFIVGFIFFILYFLVNYILFQDVFHRSQLIVDGHYSMGSYYDKSYSILLKRLTYEPIFMLIGSEMAIVLIFTIPTLMQADYKKIYKADSFINFWGKSLLIVLLMFWFSSTSYRYYNPMSLQPRMILLMIPAASIIAAYSILNVTVKQMLFLASSFMVCAVLQYYLHSPNYPIYIMISIGCFVLFFFRTSTYVDLIKITIVFILLAHPLYSIIYNNRNPELTGTESLMNLIIKKKEEIHTNESVKL